MHALWITHSLNHLLTTHSSCFGELTGFQSGCWGCTQFALLTHKHAVVRISLHALICWSGKPFCVHLRSLLWIQFCLSAPAFLAPVATDEVDRPNLLLISALILFISSTSFSSLRRACFSLSSCFSNLLMYVFEVALDALDTGTLTLLRATLVKISN